MVAMMVGGLADELVEWLAETMAEEWVELSDKMTENLKVEKWANC